MKSHLLTATLAGLLMSGGTALLTTPPAPVVHFSPAGGCTAEVVANIDGARREVLVQAYSFTSVPIAEALVNAGHRGVDVSVIIDAPSAKENGSQAKYLASNGVTVRTDAAHKIAHNKIVIVDGTTVLTGSFNLSVSAELHNSENLLTVHSGALATRYVTNWHVHQEHSVPYAAK